MEKRSRLFTGQPLAVMPLEERQPLSGGLLSGGKACDLPIVWDSGCSKDIVS